MSLVSYFGNPKYAPKFSKNNLIDFSEKTLLQGFFDGDK